MNKVIEILFYRKNYKTKHVMVVFRNMVKNTFHQITKDERGNVISFGAYLKA